LPSVNPAVLANRPPPAVDEFPPDLRPRAREVLRDGETVLHSLETFSQLASMWRPVPSILCRAFDPLPRLRQHHAGGFQAGDGGAHGGEVRLTFEVQQGVVALADDGALLLSNWPRQERIRLPHRVYGGRSVRRR
jgi:hypothetical protein